MYCIIITYMYRIFETYDDGKCINDYEIYFHNTENDCELRFISVKSKLIEQYNKFESELNKDDINYTTHQVPQEDDIF